MTEVLAKELLIKVVVTGRDRCVAGVDGGSTDELESFIEGKVLAFDIVKETLYAHEGSVPFVHVVDILGDAEALEQKHATEPEEVLLLHAVLPVTTIELVRDGAVPFAVLWDVGVEEIEADAPYIDLPDVAEDGVVGVGHFEDERCLTIGFKDLLDGELCEVLRLVVGLLLPFGAEVLGEVTIAVEEADSRQADIAVAGFLEVVTSQYAETTGVNLEDVRQTILHAEVGYRGANSVSRLAHIGTEVGVDFVQLSHKVLVRHEGVHLLFGEQTREGDGVAFCGFP